MTSVELHRDVVSAAALAREWDALADVCGRPCCASAWLLGWARHAAPGGLRIAAVRDGDGALLGVVPAVLARDRGLRRLRLLGSGTVTSIDALALPGREAEVAAAAAPALAAAAPRADVIALDGVPGASSWPGLLLAHWPGARPGMLYRRSVVEEPLVRLHPDGWDAWLAARSGNFRGQLRRAQRALAREGGAVRRSDARSVRDDVRAFVALHHGRWEDRGGTAVVTAQIEAMLDEAAPALLAAGRLDLWCVDLGGRTVGAQLWLRSRDAVSMWLSGSDDDAAAVRPAMLILAAAVEDAHGSGLASVSLGAGGQPYKRRFAEDDGEVVWWTLAVPGPRLPAVAAELAARRAWQALGEGRRERLRALVRRF